MRHKLYIIGAGPGRRSLLTQEAEEALRQVSQVAAAPRLSSLAGGHVPVIPLGPFSETFETLTVQLQTGPAAVLLSGDTGVFSLLPLLKKNFPDTPLEVIPGISSLQYFCAALKTTWIDAAIISGHGRELREASVLDAADQQPKAIFFCGPEWPPHRFCRLLADAGMDHIRLSVGENLSYPGERILTGTPSDLARQTFSPFALVMTENPSPWHRPSGRPRDEDFIRARVPMTRETVRSAILDMLCLEKDSLLWDLGAGTGSISVAAALACPEGQVCAVEKNSEACGLIGQNARKFHIHNMTIHRGDNLEVLPILPEPTHVFVGGSGPELPSLLTAIAGMKKGIRVVLSAVALKTYAAAAELMSGPLFEDFDALTVAVSRAKKLGNTFIMEGRNPVTLFTARTAGGDPEPDSQDSGNDSRKEGPIP